MPPPWSTPPFCWTVPHGQRYGNESLMDYFGRNARGVLTGGMCFSLLYREDSLPDSSAPAQQCSTLTVFWRTVCSRLPRPSPPSSPVPVSTTGLRSSCRRRWLHPGTHTAVRGTRVACITECVCQIAQAPRIHPRLLRRRLGRKLSDAAERALRPVAGIDPGASAPHGGSRHVCTCGMECCPHCSAFLRTHFHHLHAADRLRELYAKGMHLERAFFSECFL